jgi:hypothetical protein
MDNGATLHFKAGIWIDGGLECCFCFLLSVDWAVI